MQGKEKGDNKKVSKVLQGKVWTSVVAHCVGCMTFSCHACGALMFKDESSKPVSGKSSKRTYSLCHQYGTMKLPPLKEPPEKLKHLLTGNTKSNREFRTNI